MSMATLSLFLNNNGNGFGHPLAVINGILYYVSGVPGSPNISYYNISTSTSATLIADTNPHEAIENPIDGTILFVTMLAGNRSFTYYYVSGTSILVSQAETNLPPVFNMENAGLFLLSGWGFAPSISKVFLTIYASHEPLNSSIIVAYTTPNMLSSNTLPSTVTTSYAFDLISQFGYLGYDNPTVGWDGKEYWVLLTAGISTNRGSWLLTSTADFSTATSIAGSHVSGATGNKEQFYSNLAITPNLGAFVMWNQTNQDLSLVWFSPYNTSSISNLSYVALGIPVSTANLVGACYFTTAIYGNLILINVAQGPSQYDSLCSEYVMIYDTKTNSLISLAVSVNADCIWGPAKLSPSQYLFSYSFVGSTLTTINNNSSIMALTLDNGISLSISMPALSEGASVTAQVYTFPATSGITISLYNATGYSNTKDFEGFGGTLLGTGVTNSSGVATISFTVPSQQQMIAVALYGGG